jgi:hypothetical protein
MPHNLFKHGDLITLMWPGNRVGLTAVIGICAGDDTKDGIIVCFRVFESLQDNRTNRVCSTVATSTIIKSIAVSFRVI